MLVNTPADNTALNTTLKDKKMNSCSSFTFSCLAYTTSHDRISEQRVPVPRYMAENGPRLI